MKDMHRRLARLEAAHPMGAARSPTAEGAAFAYVELTKIMDAIAAEKAAGDVHGVAARQIAELIAASDQVAAEPRA